MSAEITSNNPVVKAIITGTAPQPARLAAARGLLPLPQNDLLEILVALAICPDSEIAAPASETLGAESADNLVFAAKADDSAPAVLSYLATERVGSREIQEALILNNKTPDQALANLAATTSDGSLLEILAINQQRLVRSPEIIEAILANSARTPEAERRARRDLRRRSGDRGARAAAGA